MANENRSPRPRSWLDALVATALRWNDRLSRPVHARSSTAPRPGSRPTSIEVSNAAARPKAPSAAK